MSDSQAFPYTCTIERRTAGAANEIGDATYAWADLDTEVICNFQDKGSVILSGKINIELENPVAFFQFDQDIQIEDRISDIAKDDVVYFAGPYRVTGKSDNPPMLGESGHKQVDLEQVD